MKEKWIQICQIQGYEEIKDCYWISNADEDKIVNKSTGKQLKSRLNEKGYKRVDLRTIDGKAKTCKIYVINIYKRWQIHKCIKYYIHLRI